MSVKVDRSPVTCQNGENLNDDNSDHSGDRLHQNSENGKNGDNESLQTDLLLEFKQFPSELLLVHFSQPRFSHVYFELLQQGLPVTWRRTQTNKSQ